MPNPHHKPAPEPQDDTPKSSSALPESPDGGGALTTPMGFRFEREAVAAYLNFAFHAHPEAQGWIADFRADGRPDMVGHFREAYQSIAHDVEETFEARPDITPKQLLERVLDVTRWHESPYSEVGGEAFRSEAGVDRKFVWDAAHITVFNVLGGAFHAPGDEDGDEENDLSTDPAHDIELTMSDAAQARHEALFEALRLAHRAVQQSSEALAAFTPEAGLEDMAQPYLEAYASTLANLTELVRQRPDVTSEDLVRIMETRCEMPQETLGETARRVGQNLNPCAWQFGEKEAREGVLSLLASLLTPAPTPLETHEREHRRGFAHAPEEIARLLEEGLHTAPELARLLKDMRDNEGLRHMTQHFESAYALAVNDLRTTFASEPDLTPDRLFRKLWAYQRQFDAGVLGEDREFVLSPHRAEQSYALVHGYQAALTVLARLVPVDRP